MGIDLGGTKTEVLVLDSAQQPVYRERLSTPAQDYDEILAMIEAQVDAMQSRFGADLTLGIGIPGAISPQTGLLRNSNTVCLNGRAFLRDIESRLGREVRIENDANCFALSEALGGAGQGYRVVFGVIIGTGTGGGLVVDGRLLNGPHSITGEWGHNPLPWWSEDDGKPDCYCGKQACIETFLSGPGLARNYQRRFGESCDSSGIVAAAARGDQSCIDMLDSYHDQMARSLAQLINILDPDAIVLGGGMSNIDTIYTAVANRLGDYLFSDFAATPLLKAMRGDSSGVYGAAFLWE
jgi:fructokinase